MFLSGGVGFQSTQVIARSRGCGAKTSTATTLRAPARANRVMSNSYRRNVPATSFLVAARVPFTHTFARKLMPLKFSHSVRPRIDASRSNSLRYHQETLYGLSAGFGSSANWPPIGYVVLGIARRFIPV